MSSLLLTPPLSLSTSPLPCSQTYNALHYRANRNATTAAEDGWSLAQVPPVVSTPTPAFCHQGGQLPCCGADGGARRACLSGLQAYVGATASSVAAALSVEQWAERAPAGPAAASPQLTRRAAASPTSRSVATAVACA